MSARYDFCHTIRDERLVVVLAYDVECEIEVSFELHDGAPEYSVDAVYVEGQNLGRGGELAKMMGAIIANAAEDEIAAGGDLLDQIMASEGVTYRGLGGNDPDGRYVRVRS